MSSMHLRAALISVDPERQYPQTISFQYNPTTLTRTLEVKNGEGGGVEALKLYGAPVETIKLEAEFDATDSGFDTLGPETRARFVAGFGDLQTKLATLEILCYPKSSRVIANTALLASGALEVIPPQGPLILFAWGPKRVLPVQIAELSITEEAHNAALAPIRARVSLSLRVLSYDDLPAEHLGHSLFLAHQIAKEHLAASSFSIISNFPVR